MADAHSYKLLIIDDEKTMQAMLRLVFCANGFEVVSAFTGEDGLLLAKSERPDFIILDVIMPGIKGREVCARLKADPDTQGIPVLFLTSKCSDDDIQAEIAVGAIAHVTKPVNAMALVQKVKDLLKA